LTGITSEWQRVLVPLNALTGINDWRRVHELSLSFESRRLTAEQGAYLIDDVVLVRTGEPGPSINDPVIPLKKHAWERSVGGRQQALGHIRAKLVGWPAKRLVGAEELPNDDRAFLERLARDTWRGLDALTVRETGLPLDHVRFAADSVEAARAEIGDYTSPTYVGLSMMAAVSAMDLGLVSSEEVQARIARLLDTLDRLETHRGFFFNYYDAISLERTSHFLSFVDSSWLTTGLIVARAAFPELHARCSRLIDAQNYGFFYDPVKGQMSHGYYVNLRIPSEYHYGMLYTEARVGALIAIGKDDAPESLWFEMVRTFPASDTWQTLTPTQRRIKEIDGNRFAGGFYQWRSHDYVPSWGGRMFEALMPTLALDEQRFAPESLGKNDVAHATIQRLYATEVLDYPVWGASPSASPDGTYGEFGVPVLGTLGYPASVVTPHASALALGVTPEQATSNLRTIARRYPIYGEYGFYDAVDPESGEVDPAYLVLDQAMLFLATASFLSDRSIQKRFAADPIVRKALPLIGQERFFD
jgi:hypothetical protein